MRDKFSCGHLILQKDGTLKLLGRNESGGSRVCKITHFDMNFDEIHDRLREMFSIGDRNSRIYDVNRKELDKNQYRNFYDYMDKKGANYKGNALFLCTLADDRIDFDSPTQRRTTVTPQSTSDSVPVVTNNIRQIEVPPTPLIVTKREQEPPAAFNKLFMNHQQLANLQISSYSNYSFGQSLNELVDYLNDLLQQYHHEKILIELYGQICTLRGLTLTTPDRIKQQNHQINEEEKAKDNQELEKINILSRSIKAFIELHKITISHIDQYSIITNSFNKFQEHFNTLCDRRANEKNTHKRRDSVKPTRTSSTSRRYSDTHSRKRTEVSSRSPSSYRQTTETTVIDNGYSLFKELLKSLDSLFKILRERRFISFGNLVMSLIYEMELCRSNIKLSDYRSLSDAENLMLSTKNHLLSRINNENNRMKSNKVPNPLVSIYKKVLDSFDTVLNSIQSFQSKINKHKRSRPRSHEKQRTIRKSTQSRTKVADDNESSDASHSSVDDEVLQKQARDTCRQGSQHRK